MFKSMWAKFCGAQKALFRKIGIKLQPAWKRFCLYFFDFCSFLGCLAFTAYIIVLMQFGFGHEFLNYTLLGLSLMFAGLYIVKMLYYNPKATDVEATKNLRKKFKTTKYWLKIFMLVVLIVGIISIFKHGNIFKNLWAAIMTLVSNVIFIGFLWWDTKRMMRARRKAKTSETTYIKKNWETVTKAPEKQPAPPPLTPLFNEEDDDVEEPIY